MSHQEGSRKGELLALSLCSLFIAWRYRFCFQSAPFQSVDLHPHIELTRKVAEQLQHGRLIFYDSSNFSGWVVGLFYPTLAHVLGALVALPLQLVSGDPFRLAVQSLLGLSLVFLPFSLCLLSRSLTPERTGQGYFASLFAILFLSLPLSAFGIGGEAAIALGLYPQVLSWNPLLVLLSLSAERSPRASRLLPILLCSLLLLHPITAMIALTLGPSLRLFRLGWRETVWPFFLGVLLSGFWLFPFRENSATWLPIHPIASKSNVLALLFSEQAYSSGRKLLSAGTILAEGVFLLGFLLTVWASVRKRNAVSFSFLFPFVLPFFLQSDVLLETLGGSFHSYRLSGPLALCLFAGSAAALGGIGQRFGTAAGVLLAMIPAAVLLCAFPPGIAQESLGLFQSEHELAQTIPKLLNDRGARTYFEYLGLSEKDRHPSPHFLFSEESRLQDTLNGLFLQSSLAHRFIDWSVKGLGIRTYGLPEIMPRPEHFSADELLEQVRQFHLAAFVVESEREILPLGKVEGLLSRPSGAYTLFKIPTAQSSNSRKLLRAYRDDTGGLPFQYLEYLFYSSHELSTRYDLVELPNATAAPKGLAALLINGARENTAGQELGLRTIQMSIALGQGSKFLGGEYAPEAALFKEAQAELIGRFGLIEKLAEIPPINTESMSAATPGEVIWDFHSQSLHLRGLAKGMLTVTSFAASPGWSSKNARLYRALPERLSFVTEEEQSVLEFSYWNLRGAVLGSFTTAVALCLWIFFSIPRKAK